MMLKEYAHALKPHEASVALALLELIRRADGDGKLERGEWLAAVQRGYQSHRAEPGEGAALLNGSAQATETETEEQARYLDDQVLARLSADGIVTAEPASEAWERARLAEPARAELAADRAGVEAALEHAVWNLLHGPGDKAHAVPLAPGSGILPGGSKLAAQGMVKIYRKRRVVADVNVAVSQGEIVGLLGPNGAGKTTTFYMMVGLIAPDAGRVFLDKRELTRVPMYKRARAGLGYLAQEPSIFRKLTVEQNILAILETMRLRRAERKRRLERLLDELGLRHLRNAKAYSLSGGERRRLEITRALVAEPKFMLLDEPFAGVDPIAVHDIQQIVADLRHRGIGVIITDHNVEQTLDIVDRAYIMYDGKVRVSGTVAELVWSDEVAEIYFGPTLTARMRERYPPPGVVA
jgi:lipopolysaccharide export system ATP-binding protein